MRREILPNIVPSILADVGVRFSGAIILAASVNFLGLGAQPPAANWGLMIAENREIIARTCGRCSSRRSCWRCSRSR